MAHSASHVEQARPARQADALVRPKLYIPQTRPNGVPRPRLLARLNAALDCPLTLIVAPPGFGKTTLLGEWIAAAPRAVPVAWVSLDEHDNAPARWGRYILAALGTLEIGLGEDLLAEFSTPTPPTLEAAFTALVNQAAEITEDFVLVLDDYHFLTRPEIHTALAFLVAHLPPRMHLILASRAEPPFAVAHLRARGQLVELRPNDLRFTPEEATTFLNQAMGLALTPADVTALEARTEGWIAGLQLAALSMRDHTDHAAFIHAFTGSHRYIFDYLAEQVLNQQAPATQIFLLETAVLDRLSGAACEALIGQGDSLAQLERLERANLFLVALDNDRHWYRYHHLFADFLRERLRQTQPARWSELHRRAARWCEQNGLIPEAVGHALAVGDADDAARLIEQIAESIWMHGEMIHLLGWLEALPPALVRARPRLCIFYAWILNILGRYDDVEARLNDAERQLEQIASPAERATIRGMIATERGIVAMMEGEVDRTLEFSEHALRDLPPENLVWRSVVVRNQGNAYLLRGDTLAAREAFQQAVAMSERADNLYMMMVTLYELAELHIVCGQLHQAEALCRRAIRLATERHIVGMAVPGALHSGLSEILREWNRLDEARHEAEIALDYGRAGRSLGVQVCGYTRLGMIHQAQGHPAHAQEAFHAAIQLAPTYRRTSFLTHHDAQARLWWRQGNLAQTARWTQDRGLAPNDELNYLNEMGYLTLARVLLAQGQLAPAARLLQRLHAATTAQGRVGRVVEINLLQARLHHAQGNHPAALAALQTALTLAEPAGYVRLFVDEGEPLRRLIADCRLQMKNQPTALTNYTDRLLAAFAPTIANHQSPIANLPEPLSERELEILRLLAAGQSNHEIAQRLVVALSTIQWHLKNLYSKLAVHSRTQALARARELNLMD